MSKYTAEQVAEEARVLREWIFDGKGNLHHNDMRGKYQDRLSSILEAYATDLRESEKAIPMILFCPMCGVQHIDAPRGCDMGIGCDDAGVCYASSMGEPEKCSVWTNPPHRSHLCAGCGCIWRPADVPTTGVAAIDTRGKADTFDANTLREREAAKGGVTDFNAWWNRMMRENFDFGPHEERYTDEDRHVAEMAWHAALSAVLPMVGKPAVSEVDESTCVPVNGPNTFAHGWNACRAAMLTAAPSPPASEEDGV